MNAIQVLVRNDGTSCVGQDSLKKEIVDFYRNLMGSAAEELTMVDKTIVQRGAKLNHSQQLFLCADCREDEMNNALFSMNPHKAPGINGFNALFFQKAWNIVGGDLVLAVKQFFATGFRWQKLKFARKLENWAAVNFSSPCDMKILCGELVRGGEKIGFPMNEPRLILEEKLENANKPASVRVDEMIKDVLDQVGDVVPKFLLCILPENKNCYLYGPLKRKTLLEVGIITQCVATPDASQPPPNYIRNLLLKINAKLFGLNWVLGFEIPKVMKPPRICEVNTLIIGLGLCHVPGKPSIAAAVGSVSWPLGSRYAAATRSQPLGSQIIQALCRKLPRVNDTGMIRQLLDLYTRITPCQLPDRIIIFRDGDGVSESEFDQVLRVELDQIVKACKLKEKSWSPKMMVVVARERHNTTFFHAINILPGTMVDTRVCHTTSNDFYLCAEGGSTASFLYNKTCPIPVTF